MLRNHLKVAFRHLFKNRLVAGINVLGLGLGLTVAIFILLYVNNEFTYDQWIPEKENIYRVYRTSDNGKSGMLITPGPVAAALREEVPGVISATRAMQMWDIILTWEKMHYPVENVVGVDSLFFETIPLTFKYGDRRSISKYKDQVVISAALAKRIFGEQNPIGEVVTIQNDSQLPITGVLEEPAGPTHLRADIYVIEDLYQTTWSGGAGYTYARIGAEIKTSTIEETLSQIAKRELIKEDSGKGNKNSWIDKTKWKLQPFTAAHLGSAQLGETQDHHGNPWQIKLLIMVGLLVLLLAGINYINLVTAQTGTRAKEIGIRAVTGASRQQLIGQLLVESLVVNGFALLVALGLAQLLLPYFNEVVSRPLSIRALVNGPAPIYLLLLTGLMGFVSGIFPALYLSKLQPVQSLKAKFFTSKETSVYRNSLIVFQFALSIGMILFITLVWQQVNFVLDKELGFKGEQIAVFRINESETVDAFPTQKARFENISGVTAVSQCSNYPGQFRTNNYSMDIEGQEETIYCNLQLSDLDWNEVYQMPLVEGRFFSTAHPADTNTAFVVNQTFVKKYGLENPIGHRMKLAYDETYSTIVGVIEDFHYQGLQHQIEPLVIAPRMNENWMGRVAIRFDSKQTSSVIAAVSKSWQDMEPVFPVSYSFTDADFAEQYAVHVRFGKSMTYAAIICLLIALSGLFGLTVFIIQRRTKEIGIRKVLGASITSIIVMLSKDFLKLVFLALMVAMPLAWYFADEWLNNFAYRITIQPWILLLTGLATIGIAFLTLSWQSVKAAIQNPVKALRNE